AARRLKHRARPDRESSKSGSDKADLDVVSLDVGATIDILNELTRRLAVAGGSRQEPQAPD
ncbi:hypothetical protein, partial [Bradyrhizobium sp.]|uniref:hypothetical protein n=1 Tax=Bradyrhizobium sp. TaxID=376 RepID=UPI003C364E2C